MNTTEGYKFNCRLCYKHPAVSAVHLNSSVFISTSAALHYLSTKIYFIFKNTQINPAAMSPKTLAMVQIWTHELIQTYCTHFNNVG